MENRPPQNLSPEERENLRKKTMQTIYDKTVSLFGQRVADKIEERRKRAEVLLRKLLNLPKS